MEKTHPNFKEGLNTSQKHAGYIPLQAKISVEIAAHGGGPQRTCETEEVKT